MIYIILILLILQNVQNANAKKSMCKPRAWEPKLPKATLSEQWAMMGRSTSLVEIFKIDWNFLYYGYVPGLQEYKHPKNKLQFEKKKRFLVDKFTYVV